MKTGPAFLPRGVHGQVLIMAAVALVLFCMLAALAIDVGYMYCTQAQLQNAGDAAAMAAALELFDERNAGHTESVARTAATTEGGNFVHANHAGAGSTVYYGAYSGGTFTEQGVETRATAVKVNVSRDASSPSGRLHLFFSPIFGHDDVAVSAESVVQMTGGIIGLRGGSGLRPFAIDEAMVAGWTPGASVTVIIPGGAAGCGAHCAVCGKKCGTGSGGCGTKCPVCGLLCGGAGWVVPGNWGWLDLNGGANSIPELRDWILNGYSGDITLNSTEGGRKCVWIEGDTGQRTTLQSDFEQLLGQVICICVYDTSSGSGSNGQFRIVGFVAFKLTSVDFAGGGDDTINGQLLMVSNVPYGYTGNGGSPYNNVFKIQLVK